MRTVTPSAMKAILVLVATLGLLTSGPALAWGHGGHVRFGVVVGGPVWWGPGYYAPYGYYPPPYYYGPAYYPWAPAAPPVYVERGAARPAPHASYYYYCAASKGYYPYVKTCPGGWQRVLPQAPQG